jgi:hypothetical protein
MYPSQKRYTSEINFYTRIRFVSSETKTLKVSFLSAITRIFKLMTFGDLSNNVDSTGTGSMRVVASKVAITYGSPVSF